MLKSQRSARQVRHPHALYTPKGQLSCSLCRAQIKSEAQWEQHLRSEQHNTSLKRTKVAQSSQSINVSVNKKRKASDEDDASAKRVRSAAPKGDRPDAASGVEGGAEAHGDYTQMQSREMAVVGAPLPPVDTDVQAEASVQPDEWEAELAAFDRDMEDIDRVEHQGQQHAQDVMKTYDDAATINAQPLSAAELAARDREEKSAQKRTARDMEAEDEREEAAGQLQDEIERMNTYDEKIRALRARKEALAHVRTRGATNWGVDQPSESEVKRTSGQDQDESSEAELDEWAFGRPVTA